MPICDSYASLPEPIRKQVDTLVEPPDPEAWARTPLPALGGRTFLDAYNSDDGEMAAAAYFASVAAFEREQSGKSPVEDLGAVLHFDGADLDSNRAGRISPQQRSRLWHRDELQMAGAGASMAGGVTFNVALLAGWMTVHGRGAGLGVSLMLIGGMFGGRPGCSGSTWPPATWRWSRAT